MSKGRAQRFTLSRCPLERRLRAGFITQEERGHSKDACANYDTRLREDFPGDRRLTRIHDANALGRYLCDFSNKHAKKRTAWGSKHFEKLTINLLVIYCSRQGAASFSRAYLGSTCTRQEFYCFNLELLSGQGLPKIYIGRNPSVLRSYTHLPKKFIPHTYLCFSLSHTVRVTDQPRHFYSFSNPRTMTKFHEAD